MLELDGDCDGALAPSGLRFVSVEHQDNAQKSIEEASRLDQVSEDRSAADEAAFFLSA
jgi:hypothetical protein